MIKKLFINQWRETTRSVIWTRNLVANILLGLLYLLLVVNFLTVGLAINEIFAKVAPGKDPVTLLNSGLLFYFLADILLRIIFQKNHGLFAKPYLYLPLKRSTLVNYLLSKSFLSIFNFLPLFFVIPFLVKVVIPAHSLIQGLTWLIAFISVLLVDCFIVAFLKKSSLKTSKYGVYAAILLAAVIVSDKYNYISISSISASFFSGFITNPGLVLIPIALFAGVYFINYRLLINNFYLENFETQKKIHFRSFKLFDILESFGETGKYISLELKLLLRNKRSRTMVLYSLSMILIGFFIYPAYTNKTHYPRPSREVQQKISAYKISEKNDPDAENVTFKVISKNVPTGATVFIAGNLKFLKDGKSDELPLIKQQDGSWVETLPIKKSTKIEYKITLGKPNLEPLNGDGSAPKENVLNVTGDTTLIINAASWSTPKEDVFSLIMLIYFGIIITGIFLLTYGQFVLSWESSYFDAIITKEINFNKYLHAKYMIMIVAGCIIYLISLFYGFFGMNIVKINTAAFLYNIGVNPFVLMFIATFNRKRFDLSISMMSQQGKGAGQYLAVIPTLLIPTAIIAPLALWGYQTEALLSIGFLGIAGLIFHKQLMRLILKQFFKQKYKMAAGFRQV